MENKDKFIRDTPHGKLMESMKNKRFWPCSKCKYHKIWSCKCDTDEICLENSDYYFAKDEPNETEKV